MPTDEPRSAPKPAEALASSLVTEKGHRLGHTLSATVWDMRTDKLATAPGCDEIFSLSGCEGRVVDGILARLAAPYGYDGFSAQVRAVRGCRRPVRLAGRVVGIEPTGKLEVRFDTGSLSDGVLLKACGTRRETLCPPCASLYRGDVFALVAAGLRGGKDVPESVADHPAVFLTLTAPSFGAVHRRRSDGSCHPTGVRCPHGRRLVCGRRHDDSDDALGQAVCADCYDYKAAVLFNAGVSELWRRTTIYALRTLGSLLSMSAREAARSLRLSYVKVAEFQRRGSVHLHAVVRADVRDDEHGVGPSVNAGLLATALRIAASKVSAPLRGSSDGRRMTWGEQVDAAIITDAENGRRRAAAYLAKYSSKGSDVQGVLDHRLRAGIPSDRRLPDHLRRLVETAWTLGEDADKGDLRLRLWAHTCGFRGHFLTKSQRYSTTFGALRAERQRWRIADRQARHPDTVPMAVEGGEFEIREWTYKGAGYATAGDACLVRNIEEEVRAGRVLSREVLAADRSPGTEPDGRPAGGDP